MLFLFFSCQNENVIGVNVAEGQTSYKITSLDNLAGLKPVIENVKKVKSKGSIYAKSNDDFLNLDNVNTDEIIQYTNESGFSTYTFKIENTSETINFENLHLIEVDSGYIAYILSYEPDPDWYNANLSSEKAFYFDITTFQGDITKYTLEKETIWSTKNQLSNKSSKNSTMSKSSGGYFVQVCTISPPSPCLEGRHNDTVGWDDCAYSDGKSHESCQTVWVSGGGSTSPDGDDGTTGGYGGGTDGEDCTDVSGTSIVDSQPISGISTNCAPNAVIGITTNTFDSFWTNLSLKQREFLIYRPNILNDIVFYLNTYNYAPQAQRLVGLTIDAVKAYVDSNSNSPEAEAFGEQAAKAILDGGEVDFEKGIIVTIVNECQKEILIEGLDNCSPLSSLVIDIFGGDYDIDYIIESSNLGPNTSASTSNIVKYNSITKKCFIKTVVDKNYLDTATDLSIARTMIHESFHATLTFMVAEGKFIYNGSPDSNFANVMNGYINYLETNTNDQYEGAQHEILLELVSEIATALKNYGIQNGYTLPSNFYSDLSWGGLTHLKDSSGSIIINPLFVDAVPNVNDRTRIINTIAAEATNNNQGSLTPKGKPCD